MSEAPVFVLDQPSRQQVQLDLSAASMHGDFAFTATNVATGGITYYNAYHTGERMIFLDVLHRMAHARTADEVLADIACIRSDVDARTVGRTATNKAEHDFDSVLPRWLTTLPAAPAPHTYRASTDNRYNLALTPTDEGLTVSWQRGDTPRPRDPTVRIPTGELWRFAAGMTWRSYEDGRSVPFLTRTSTVAYDAALYTFQSSITSEPTA